MTTMTPEDAIRAASSIARDVADGKLSPSDLERQAVAELRELVGTVVGPDDPAWPLQVDIARQVLALDGIPATELSEWLAVARHRAEEPVSQPEMADLPAPDTELPDQREPEPRPAPEPVAPEPAAAAEQPAPTPIPPARPGQYDPLAHWPASRSLQR